MCATPVCCNGFFRPRASYPFPFSLVKIWEKYGENHSAKIQRRSVTVYTSLVIRKRIEEMSRIALNESNAQTLAILRDTLLPRLISVQLRLPEAEVLLEAAEA